ncbi:MAG: PEP-CTERM sorting domain-containing protein [Proteobacteria bacterium]|nr:PEP-CTERM sorting domain-containing protein [Pseudomonadota bacterium]
MALLAAYPAQSAASVTFAIDGYFNVTRIFGMDPSTWPASCAGLSFCSVTALEHHSYSGLTGTSLDGISWNFSGGDLGTRESYWGTATYLGNGAYHGDTAYFHWDNHFIGADGPAVAFQLFQTSPAPVPEPSSWLMLLAGMFGVGAAVRARPRMRLTFTRPDHIAA